jgi:hypothetical protein
MPQDDKKGAHSHKIRKRGSQNHLIVPKKLAQNTRHTYVGNLQTGKDS